MIDVTELIDQFSQSHDLHFETQVQVQITFPHVYVKLYVRSSNWENFFTVRIFAWALEVVQLNLIKVPFVQLLFF